MIIKNGTTTFDKPVGTGPFAFAEFTPGERSLCTANPNYWDAGKPYVDEWEDISIDDNAARLNALLGGEIDMMPDRADPGQGAPEDGKIQVLRAPSTAAHVFLMATDVAPFDDPLVRQALRLVPDRQGLIDRALLGFGTIANDLPGAGLWNFADDLPPRDQDLDQAKALLAQAGKVDLEVTLQTSDIVPGFVEAATLFAEQAKDAGVKVNVKKEAANAYFDTSKLYTKMAFAQSFWTFGSWGSCTSRRCWLGRQVWNETHFRDPAFDKLIRDAQAATDEAAARRSGTRSSRSSTTRAATSSGPTGRSRRTDQRRPRPDAQRLVQPRRLRVQERLVRSVAWARASLPPTRSATRRRPRHHGAAAARTPCSGSSCAASAAAC